MNQKTIIEFTYCHRKPERSFFWKGKQFPVCARCTGIHVGYISFILFLFGIIKIPLWISLLMIAPTYLDGVIQAVWNIESTNSRRFITGMIAGVGTSSLVSIAGIFTAQQLLKLFN